MATMPQEWWDSLTEDDWKRMLQELRDYTPPPSMFDSLTVPTSPLSQYLMWGARKTPVDVSPETVDSRDTPRVP